MEIEQVYLVTTEGDCEGRSIRTLGYATGKVEDIRAYYDDKKMYEISVKPITILAIDKTTARDKIAMLQRKKELEAELEKLKKLL